MKSIFNLIGMLSKICLSQITEAAIQLNLAPIASDILKTQKDDDTVSQA